MQPVDPEIDRALDRSPDFNPPLDPPQRQPRPGQGEVPRDYDVRQRNMRQWLQYREQRLSQMSTIYRRAITSAMGTTEMQEDIQELAGHERIFRRVMRENPSGALSADARRAALDSHDAAYDFVRPRSGGASAWDRVRQRYWKAFYRSEAGRRWMAAARITSINGQPLVEITDEQMANGRAPRILTPDREGRMRYVDIDVDHTVPLQRNPFGAFSPDNLALKIAPNNRGELNRYASRSVFPMGRQYGAVDDDIEDFVQRHQLSRTQRPPSERPGGGRRARAASTVGTLLLTALGVEQLDSVAHAAYDARGYLRRRTEINAQDNRIDRDGLDTNNLSNFVQRVFDRSPLELNRSRAELFRRAAVQWISRAFRRHGTDFERVDAAIRTAAGAGDDVALSRLLDEVGHPSLMDLSGFVFGSRIAGVQSSATRLRDARRDVAKLLSNQREYQARASAAERLANVQPDEILSTLPDGLAAAAVDDVLAIHRQTEDVAAQYRTYVRVLNDALALIDEAIRVNNAWATRIITALDRLGRMRD